MNAPVVIRCSGAPRDLGLDQGAALRNQVRRAARARGLARRRFNWARSAARGAQNARLRRDLLRYFPHQAERIMGLARGAGVGSARLAALLAQTHAPGATALASRTAQPQGARLNYTLPLLHERAPGMEDFALRHSAPDNDRHSVEITFAWQAPALAGINADGLAVCALPGAADMAADVAANAEPPDCAAPALLLGQDCLRLFDRVQSALDWIRHRPAGGHCTLLLADAAGCIAGAVVAGNRREHLEVQDGRIFSSGGANAAGENNTAAANAAAPNALRVFADPLSRQLGVQPPGGELVWHKVGG